MERRIIEVLCECEDTLYTKNDAISYLYKVGELSGDYTDLEEDIINDYLDKLDWNRILQEVRYNHEDSD